MSMTSHGTLPCCSAPTTACLADLYSEDYHLRSQTVDHVCLYADKLYTKGYEDSEVRVGDAIRCVESYVDECCISGTAKNKLYIMLGLLLPSGHKLPANAYQASKYMKSFMPAVRQIPACVNDCMTFPDACPREHPTCPICTEPIFLNGKPRKLFHELSVRSVIERRFACKAIARELKKPWPRGSGSSYMFGFTGEIGVIDK